MFTYCIIVCNPLTCCHEIICYIYIILRYCVRKFLSQPMTKCGNTLWKQLDWFTIYYLCITFFITRTEPQPGRAYVILKKKLAFTCDFVFYNAYINCTFIFQFSEYVHFINTLCPLYNQNVVHCVNESLQWGSSRSLITIYILWFEDFA